MNVLITGATSMVGSNVLKLCLADKQITQVTVLGRRSCGISHHKLKEILVIYFNDLSGIRDQLALTDTVY
ncbi:MAG: NAD-dependent epimerase/dehydratase family protein [Thalassotalea sp.]|nr:NAD-dependent epimerase/dehydratase family protein [Thalassotalea sp.]